MTLNAHRASAEGTLQSAAAAAYPSVPVSFESVPFNQPESAWMRVAIVDGRAYVANIGRGRQIDRHVGCVQVDCLVPENTGTAAAIMMAEWAGGLFRLQNVALSDGSTVRYRVPDVSNHGIQSGMFRCTMRVPYWRDEVPA
jgi:hypothetical protein